MAEHSNFDWYISPADRFSYETQFAKYSSGDDDYTEITLPQLDPIFHQSRLPTEDFLQIWQLVDIKYQQSLNKCQFIYFMHILSSRRRGRPLPVGLSLHIKEEFLKEVSNRMVNVRDVGASVGKDANELEMELAQLELDASAAHKEYSLAADRLKELGAAKAEVQGISTYIKNHHQVLEKEVAALKENTQNHNSTSNSSVMDTSRVRELISKVTIDKEALEYLLLQLKADLDTASRSLEI
ncbi:hypothetical protein BASA50_009109 [Batrachochytrium salamandrivorans]|uniref:EH domain-containing protein n=1 Tax=Batrachochytrium salamandrivorans TaxID=1357716 RepID=A0ABQ8F2U6_9FUNG|nr:hypothetical protein BASA60_006317 [Batrachochytrium salamandrivorans]KAH6591107.1 hypothetical protein BASA50_009109 [Batrachochytrium salamandrivorans]KAH9268767.1 hypothetical protein BASA84_000066 [Batrachochytrium salamandrivorans]